ncbi:hypothetical protein ACFFK0_06415 [Paenibacillus chartarius]|uniref:Uncharacterized protein n=1 Tax=Paenibacillus chartarius TaxID=747481 RepID=A0ABV6DHF9_9BACL
MGIGEFVFSVVPKLSRLFSHKLPPYLCFEGIWYSYRTMEFLDKEAVIVYENKNISRKLHFQICNPIYIKPEVVEVRFQRRGQSKVVYASSWSPEQKIDFFYENL